MSLWDEHWSAEHVSGPHPAHDHERAELARRDREPERWRPRAIAVEVELSAEERAHLDWVFGEEHRIEDEEQDGHG